MASKKLTLRVLKQLDAVSEGAVKKALKQRLKDLGCYQFWPVQKGLGDKTLDVIVCYRRLFFAFETKRPGKDMTELQSDTADAIVAAGGGVFLIDNVEKAKNFNFPEYR